MANIRINTPDEIEFQNFRTDVAKDQLPYISAQLGEWEMGDKLEAGIVIDAAGTAIYSPILSATDARKLAKWLNNAADTLEGLPNTTNKKHKKRTYYEEDDDTEYKF